MKHIKNVPKTVHKSCYLHIHIVTVNSRDFMDRKTHYGLETIVEKVVFHWGKHRVRMG